jgi:hypothetical protein
MGRCQVRGAQALGEGGDVVLGLLGVGVVVSGEVGGDVVGQGYSPCTGVRRDPVTVAEDGSKEAYRAGLHGGWEDGREPIGGAAGCG